jgi:hypothetical protein
MTADELEEYVKQLAQRESRQADSKVKAQESRPIDASYLPPAQQADYAE